jgi:hypothetical protein
MHPLPTSGNTTAKENAMPKISKDSAPSVEEFGPAVDISGNLDNYTVNFVTVRQGHSLAALLKGLPGDSCQCPHWGYLFAGKITVAYAEHAEVYEAGDAFYMAPGHVPAAETGRVRAVQPEGGTGGGARSDEGQRRADVGRLSRAWNRTGRDRRHRSALTCRFPWPGNDSSAGDTRRSLGDTSVRAAPRIRRRDEAPACTSATDRPAGPGSSSRRTATE